MKRHILHDLFRNILMVVIVLLMTITAAGTATNRGLAVPNDTLPAELKGVPIQDSYTGNGVNAVGEIQSVVGHVVVFREDKQYAYFAAPKDKLYERDVVYTLSASRCRFQMYSSDIATLSENTRILIKTYINNRSTGVKSTSFVMKKGKAMFYALRLFMYKGSSMEVETPTAVTGVRGTKWGMEVVESKESASLPILVADASDLSAFRQLAQANTGGSGYTIIHSFEGAVFVTSIATGISTTLQGGQSMNIGREGLGNTYPTPPEVSKQFQSDTVAQGGGGSATTSNTTETTDSTGTTGSTVSQTPPETSSIIQDQNQLPQTRPKYRYGYTVGMLTQTNIVGYAATYISKSQQDFGSIDGRAYRTTAPTTDFVRSAWNGTNLLALVLVKDGIPSPVGSQVITTTETGYNTYMTWGYWTQPVNMTVGANTYAFNNKGYYVLGDITATMPTSISGTYSGFANGTVYTTGGGTDYPGGTFSMDVNFAGTGGTVTNFRVAIGGGNARVDGSGSISGNSLSVTGSSVVNAVTGTGSAYGSFFGLDAKMVGGVWQATSGGGNANGNFYGSRP